MKNQKIVALAHSKFRNAIGMIGIEVDAEKHIAYVRLAKQWKREQINNIPADIKELYSNIKWDKTYADQLIGQHLIRAIESKTSLSVFTITTQKNLKDPEDVEKIKVMDVTEMSQLLLSLKLAHRIQFSPEPTEEMIKAIKQVEIFSEHTTEQGNVSYYAPGDELDNFTKALMICCFVGRHSLTQGEQPMIIQIGSTPKQPKPKTPEEKMFGELFYGSPQSNRIANNLDTLKAYRNKNFR